ncbi:MAG: hypothetical protein JWO31_1314 [Phycisphaerales bacterium]|nr:hypothetical protein [Phycisphaerales bacterium]
MMVAVAALARAGRAGEAQFRLPPMGGFAVSPDNATLVVSLPAKTTLVYYDTVAGKEAKRLEVEFQPTEMAWAGKVLFVAQKSSGRVHVLDADSGAELGVGNAGAPIRNLVVAKDVCFASTDGREVYAIDAKGKSSKTGAKGSFMAVDPAGAFVCTVIDGSARTDITKYAVDGTTLRSDATLQGKVPASLPNVQAVRLTGDGKHVAVVAGGGWAEVDHKRHYSVPLYTTEDMQSQAGELETGAYPSGCAVHPVLPLLFACNGKEGSVFSAKSFAPREKFAAPRAVMGATAPSVLAFVGRGRKLAWGVSNADSGVLKFYDVELTEPQQAELAKAYGGK